MTSVPRSHPAPFSSLAFDPEMARALRLLLKAHDHARAERRDAWDFAIEIAEFRTAEVSGAELRRLLCQGHVEQALEMTSPGHDRRRFKPLSGLSFPDRTCFVLTRTGVALARTVAHHYGAGANGHPSPDEVPYWDAGLGELWLDGVLVKRFIQRAALQRLVLAAFQEQGWTRRIDNPIPPDPDRDDHERLHYALLRLNSQRRPLLRFRRDGTGQGVCWERVPQPVNGNGRASWDKAAG